MSSTAKRQVAIRLLLAVCTYLVVAILAGLSFWRHGSTTVPVTHAITGGSTYITYMVEPNSSVYQDNPGPVTVILLLLLVVAIISTLSVVYRAVKHSPKVGIVGMVMASVVGAFCFVGMASVGMFLLPLAGLLVVLALPMSKLAEDLHPSRT
ncbi:MAG: hypothetical protein HIU84_14545 [Acidobacteria bacterium]|nr:hypothetical protein [Acidobacteriota bacterium]